MSLSTECEGRNHLRHQVWLTLRLFSRRSASSTAVHNVYTQFHENPTRGLAADNGSQTYERTEQRFLLQILLLAQHVSGTTMPIIRSSRLLYSGCFLWYFVLWFSSCWSGVELRVMCPVCRMLQHLLHLVGILFPHINDDARSKLHQISVILLNLLFL